MGCAAFIWTILLGYVWFGEAMVTFPLRRKLGAEDIAHGHNRSLSSFKEFGSIKREGDGVYFADLRIGTPQQMFSVIVDTGSATIAVPCEGCSCGNHHHFSIRASSSAKIAAGRYSQCYSEGSCNSGQNVRDLLCIGEKCDLSEAVPHTFGCCSRYARAFQRQEADGIIGMSGSSGTLLADLRAHHMLEDDVFALCLGRRGGSVAIGGYSEARSLEPMQWVTYTPRGSFYAIPLINMFVNGQPLTGFGGAKSPIVDSGTTFTYVPSNVHRALAAKFSQICGPTGAKCGGQKNPPGTPSADRRDSVGCYLRPESMSYNDFLMLFPTIEMQFSAQTRICLPASSYLFTSKTRIYCIGILRERSNRVVIGAITMSEFNVVFDHQHRRIGWARALCDASEHFTDVTRAACCGSCEKARSAGFGDHHPTVKPTSLPIQTPKPTTTPIATDGSVITLAASKQMESTALAVTTGQSVIIPYSTTICSTSGQPWTFDPSTSLRIKGEGTVVHIGSECPHLPTVFIDKGASLQLSPSAHVHFREAVINQGTVVLESGAVAKAAKVESAAGSVIKLMPQATISGIAPDHTIRTLYLEGGLLEMAGGQLGSDLRLGTGARMKVDVKSAFKGSVECAGVIDVPLGVVSELEGHLTLHPSATLKLHNPAGTSSVEEAKIQVFTAKKGIKNEMQSVQLDTFLNCAHGKLKVVEAEGSKAPELDLLLDPQCMQICKTSMSCPLDGGLTSGDKKSIIVKYMDEVSPFTLYVVSCTAGFLSAMAVLGCLLLPNRCCPCGCPRPHEYEPIGK